MGIIYNTFIYLYYFIILFASLFNKKARLWIKGREGIFDKLHTTVLRPQSTEILRDEDIVVWFHCSSLGEFEQGRPVIESYRIKFPQHKILLTFFSPSGYEIKKNYKGADYIFYLPIDTKRNAKKFLEIVKPQKAFFIKYEYWYNYLNLLFEKNIPVYMISAIYRQNQYFFKWYGVWFRKYLKNIKHIFIQNSESKELLNSIGIYQATVSGDTRFDRVYSIAQEHKTLPIIESFVKGSDILIAGSTWEKDEEIIRQLDNRFSDLRLSDKNLNLKFIIAPHEINEGHINELKKTFGTENSVVLLSEANIENVTDKRVLIIDSIGILSHIYKYSSIAYIGGGFGKGIHNILEAAVYGKPLIFGLNYRKFQEARDLIGLGAAFTVNNYEELINLTEKLIKDEIFRNTVSEISKNYVISKTGATKRIMNYEL